MELNKYILILNKGEIMCISMKVHTTETEATKSYNIIPASANARLAHDITTARSPAITNSTS